MGESYYRGKTCGVSKGSNAGKGSEEKKEKANGRNWGKRH